MSWSIKTSKGKWKIISSYVDDVIASFDNKNDCIEFIAMRRLYDGKKEAIETLMCFPNGWVINGKKIRNDKIKDFNAWLEKIDKLETNEEYCNEIDKKFNEIMDKIRNKQITKNNK